MGYSIFQINIRKKMDFLYVRQKNFDVAL